MLLPPGMGFSARHRKLSLRCEGNLSLPLGRLSWPGRGTGRNAWVFPPRMDAGVVQAALLNIPRDTTADVAVLVLEVELEHEPGSNATTHTLREACAPDAAGAALAASAMYAASSVPGSCVVELAPREEGEPAEAVCAVVEGGASHHGPTGVPVGEACGGTVERVFAPSGGGGQPRWDSVEVEDAARALRDAGSLDHDGHSDPRAAAHARITAAELAHQRCVAPLAPEGPHADFQGLHPSARLVEVVEPVGWGEGPHEVWGKGAPACVGDAAGGHAEAGLGAGSGLSAALRGATLLQSGASARVGALAGAREHLEAGIPGLDLMLGPIMDSVLGPVTQIIGGVIGDVVGAGLMNLVGQGTDSALTSEVTKILTSDLVGALSDQVGPPTGEAVGASVTAATAAQIRQMVPKGVGEALADAITRKLVPRLAPALAERISERVADAVAEPLSGTLQHMLTRSVTAAAVPALAHSLTHSPSVDYFCLLCKEKKLYCSYCKAGQFPATLAHAQYYAAYYGAYYAEWGAQPTAERSGKAAETMAARAAEQAAATRKSQSEWMAAHEGE